MCGLAGELVFSGRADVGVAAAMAQRLAHRGPDEAGEWLSPDGRCAIGFRRLSIIDLKLSHQPMTLAGPDGRQATVAFNGEIYNFQDLRKELAAEGFAFHTRGDAEVLPALYLRYGQEMLSRLEGMFAFALYDHHAGKLMLARDRLGKKPLWYALLADRLVFASEAKALLAHPGLSRQADFASLSYYLTLGYVPAPRSIWQGIMKLAPGHLLLVDSGPSQPQRYWSPPEFTQPRTAPEAVELVRQTLGQAVSRRMLADVPVGALLSGGVDSAVVTALMCRAAGGAGGVKTFTARFADQAFDEGPQAAALAGHLGTDHHPLEVHWADAEKLLDRLVEQYDEPFADSSALPTYLICQAARQHVKVALTGDGGDESFAGYDRYRAMELGQRLGPGKYLLTRLAGSFADAFAPHDERNRLRRLARFAAALDLPPARRYLHYRRLFDPAWIHALLERDLLEQAQVEAVEGWFCELYEVGEYDSEIALAQRHDLLSYLPDDLLVKTDIASMANGLEVRCPMLDRAAVELGLSLPGQFKFAGRHGKAILRQAFSDLLPEEVFTRPKRGFGVPLDDWLRGPLLPLLRRTLLDGALVSRGWLVYGQMEKLIQQHLARKADHRHRLWALLWLGRWLERQP
jgi:asparagine synthase (glutamine-hydrolysing)